MNACGYAQEQILPLFFHCQGKLIVGHLHLLYFASSYHILLPVKRSHLCGSAFSPFPYFSKLTNEDQRSFHYKPACSMFIVQTRNCWLLSSGSPISQENSALRFFLGLHFQVGPGLVLLLVSLVVFALRIPFLTSLGSDLSLFPSFLGDGTCVPIILFLAGGQLLRKQGTLKSLLFYFKTRSLFVFIFKITFL